MVPEVPDEHHDGCKPHQCTKGPEMTLVLSVPSHSVGFIYNALTFILTPTPPHNEL